MMTMKNEEKNEQLQEAVPLTEEQMNKVTGGTDELPSDQLNKTEWPGCGPAIRDRPPIIIPDPDNPYPVIPDR